VGLYFRSHSRTRVGDRQYHILSGVDGKVGASKEIVHHHVGGFDQQLAAVRHGILGVDSEIHEHLTHLAGVRAKSSRFAIQIEVNAMFSPSNRRSIFS